MRERQGTRDIEMRTNRKRTVKRLQVCAYMTVMSGCRGREGAGPMSSEQPWVVSKTG